jgi:diguanylate cyclase (GGDEF)-like protein
MIRRMDRSWRVLHHLAGRWAAGGLLALVVAVTSLGIAVASDLSDTVSRASSSATVADTFQVARFDAAQMDMAYSHYLLHHRGGPRPEQSIAATNFTAALDSFSGNGAVPTETIDRLRTEFTALSIVLSQTELLRAEGQLRAAFHNDQTAVDPARTLLAADIGRLEDAAYAANVSQIAVAQQRAHLLGTLAPVVVVATLLIGLTLSLLLRGNRKEVEKLALTDALTGAPNRLALGRAAQRILAAGTSHEAVFLLLDLDGFKDVNDDLGHHHGDRLLIETTHRLSRLVKPADIVARLGGDEFGVLLAHGGIPAAKLVAERIRSALREPFRIEDHSVQIDVSIGIAQREDACSDLTSLMRHADIAMYAAKAGGGGWMIYTAEQSERTRGRVQLVNELRLALARDELILHYQPKVALDDGAVHGVEALLRWQHPERGLVSPDDFLPAVEGTELMDRITATVLDKALAQSRSWSKHGSGVPIAVNIPTRSLLDARFPSQVFAGLKQYDVVGADLVLEITECSSIRDMQRSVEALSSIRNLGVRISIDDYGTGYASMSYLRDLPVDELKIDRSFVTHINNDTQGALLMRSIVELGHNLGLTVTAEGVEDDRVCQILREAGCDVAQGYLFSRPISAAAMTAWLAHKALLRTQHHPA